MGTRTPEQKARDEKLARALVSSAQKNLGLANTLDTNVVAHTGTIKIGELEDKITYILGRNLLNEKARRQAQQIIEFLKTLAGDPYKEGETEEYTFDGKGWFLILEE